MGNRVFLYNPLEMNKKELFSVFSSREAQADYLLQRIREQLEHDSVQHILVIGPRGAGKTTLLHFLQYKIKDDPFLDSSWQLVQFAEEEWGIYSLPDFFIWILEKIFTEYPETEIKDEFEKAKQERGALPNDIEPFTDLIERFCSRYGKKILLLTDNFDYIIKKNLNNEDRALLRKYLLLQNRIMIIATAVALFPEVEDYEEPFFDFFAPVYLHRLSVNQGAQLIKTRAEYESGFSPQAKRIIQEWNIHQSKIKTITELTDGNPRLLLMLYEIMKGNPLGKILDVFNQLMDDVTPYLKSVMDQISPMQSKIVDTLTRSEMGMTLSDLSNYSGIPANSLSVQLNRLEDMTFIKREKRKRKTIYVTGNKLFRTWYQMRVIRKNRRIYDLLVNMLNLFYSEEDILKKLETSPSLEEKRHYIAALPTPELKTKYALKMAEDLIKDDLYEEAREEISSVVRDSSSEGIIQMMLLKEGKFNQAEKSLKKSVEKGDPEAMNVLAVLYANQNKFDLAEKYYLLAVEQKIPNAMYNLALLYENQNKSELAEKYYILAVERKIPEAMFNLAMLYANQNKFDQAEKYFLQAVEQKHPGAMNNLAVLYSNQNKLDLGEKYFLLAVEQKDPKSMFNLAVLYENQNKFDLVEKYYLLTGEQKDTNSMNNYANFLWKQGRIPEAEGLFSRLLEHGNVAFLHKIHFLDFLFDTASIQRIRDFILFIEKELLIQDESGALFRLLTNILKNEKYLSKFKTIAREMDYSGSESLSFIFPVILAVAEFHENKTREKLDQLSTEQKIFARVLLSALGYKTDETLGVEDSSLIFGKITS
jgi:TPR repeat protein/energy-coupling factor transporter ATP-binding protein EcfA2